MTPEQIARELKEKVRKATSGPYHIHEGDLVNAAHQDVDDWEGTEANDFESPGPNWQFILAAANPAAILVLLEEREALRDALGRVKPFIYCDMGEECAGHGHWEDCATRVAGKIIDEALALSTKEPTPHGPIQGDK